MIFVHDYSGNAGRCRRCGMTRREGYGMPCELPDEIESADVEIERQER